MARPIVAIVGRPNVGKSTLFNRFTGGRTAIVEDIPGVTRDRIYKDVEWCSVEFIAVDTGGIDISAPEDSITLQVRKQAEIAIDEADAVVFVVDGRQGIFPDDEVIAETLRRSAKPVILVVNKIENYGNLSPVWEFFRLGLGDPVPVSAEHGMNTGDLLDQIIAHLPPAQPEPAPEETIKIALVGRPNVGKSSLVNALLGQQRVVVSKIPGTTRDAIDIMLNREGRSYLLIDTAGLRRKSRVDQSTERYSVIRSLRAIDRADVVLIILDATEGIAEQDKKIAGYAHEKGKASIFILNKWDLVEKDEKTMIRYEEELRRQLAFMDYAPALSVSASTGQRVTRILDAANTAVEQASIRIPTSSFNLMLKDFTALTPPPTDKGKRLKIFYGTQTSIKPPTFVLFINDPDLLHWSYKRYLENKIREAYGFKGTPIRLMARRREQRDTQ